MKINSILLYCFLVATICISADSGCASIHKNKKQIVGKWTWVKTFCCGRASVWTTPLTCSCQKVLFIKENGDFSFYENGNQNKSGKYLLRQGLNDYQYQTGDSLWVIQFNEEPGAYIRFIGDTLLLAKGYSDMANDYYVKRVD